MTDSWTKRLVFFSTGILVFIVYALTSSPGLGLVDSGELTSVTKILGIAHPTGYPLYTLLGRCWHMLGIFHPDRAMVLFSIGVAAFANGILALIVYQVLCRAGVVSRTLVAMWAVLLTCAFAFSKAAWTAVSYAEVYPLTLLIAMSILWLALQVRLAPSDHREACYPYMILYLWGLGFGNHLTILWFFPLITYIVFKYLKSSNRRLRDLFILAGFFSIGVSVNLYLPIRSSLEPALDWGDPQTFSSLIRHLSAWQYRVWMFKGDVSQLVGKMGAYLLSLIQDLGIGLTLLTLIGIGVAFVRRSALLWSLLAVWLLGTVYNLNYDIPDISTYFLLFSAVLFYISVEGFAATVGFLQTFLRRDLLRTSAISLLVFLTALSSFALTFHEANRSQDRFARNYVTEILNTLPDSAFVFQCNWDIQSPVIYLQQVENFRTDVTVLDMNLMMRSWYLKQQQRQLPQVFAGCESEVESFLSAVYPFEHGQRYDGQRIEAAFVAMHNKIIADQKQSRPVYIRIARDFGHPGIGANSSAYPGGYFFHLSDSVYAEPVLNIENIIKEKKSFDDREKFLLKEAAAFTAMQGDFAMKRNDTTNVIRALKAINPLAQEFPATMQFAIKANEYLKTEQQPK